MKRLILTAITLVVIINTNVYSFWQWVSSGLGGNYPVQAISSSGNYLFAGTNLFSNGSLYYSTNHGTQWHNMFTNNVDVLSVCSSGNFIFMATDKGIYRTKNMGSNWERYQENNYIYSVILNINSPSNIIAGCYNYDSGKIIVSTNYGITWLGSSINNTSILSLAKNGNTLYAGTNGEGLFKSTNGGFNWVHSALNVVYVNSVTSTGNYIFAGTERGLYRSTDNGNTWGLTPVVNTTIYALENHNNVIFAGVSDINNFYYSTNYGLSWISKNDGLLDIEYSSVRTIHIANDYIFIGVSNSDYDGVYRRPISEIISVQQISENIPVNFSLSQNYPNPFNPSTKIKFDISGSTGVQTFLYVFDELGREVKVLVDEMLKPGPYEADFNGTSYPSGVYYYKLLAGNFSETRKMVLVK